MLGKSLSAFRELSGLAKYAWITLAWNVVVILWGVFLRASKSGDGCGQHWLTCHGEVIPSAPELKTVIEFSHRVTSFIALVMVVALVVWVYRKYAKGEPIRKTAIGSLIFILTEALVGAGLVLTGNTAETLTATRPFWMMGHLLNTFILLAFLTLTARYASGGARLRFRVEGKYLAVIMFGIFAILIVGMSGSIAALANMIFPSETLAEGVAKDFSPTSHLLLRLRLLHPITGILSGVMLIFLTGMLAKASGRETGMVRWSNTMFLLVVVQIAFGSLTLFMLAPIAMQVGHLLLADAIWIAYVLLVARFLSIEHPAGEREVSHPSS
jgi:heme A synthase